MQTGTIQALLDKMQLPPNPTTNTIRKHIAAKIHNIPETKDTN
jgi:hypothetical protein